MIHRQQTFPLYEIGAFQRDYLTEDMLLFDIETTGLSPRVDSVYLIGCSYINGNDIVIDLFFGENPEDEAAVFEAFMPILRSHSAIITFNGTTFDIPFLKKRCPAFCPVFDKKVSVDLYRMARGMKSLLQLDSYKQKSIEKFLGSCREDKYSGGELIGMYLEYIMHQDPGALEILLLHNFDDVKGMYDLVGLLAYRQLAEGHFRITGISIKNTNECSAAEDLIKKNPQITGTAYNESFTSLTVTLETACPLPASVNLVNNIAALHLSGNGGRVSFPIHHGELKHFFQNFENYYYLPDEDYAVHKSVGEFVDPSHRRKATAKTCYVKKECDYLALPGGTPSFLRKDYNDKQRFLPLPAKAAEIQSFLVNYFQTNNL